jgi:hypothetical protein
MKNRGVQAMKTRTVSEMLDLLHDEDFARLRLRASQAPLPWRAFLEMSVPEGFTASETWAILTAMRRQTAAVLPWRSYQGRNDTLWYTVTESMATHCAELEARCRAGSPLARCIDKHPSRYFLVHPIVDELVAAARRDGLSVDYEDTREIVCRERQPRTAAEKLILNSHELMLDLDHYAGRRIGMGLIQEFYERVSNGVEGFVVAPHDRGLEIVDHEFADPDVALKMISTLASGDFAGGRAVHPAMIVLSVSSIFWDFRPLPAWNGLVELQLRRLYFRNVGYPVLAFVPLGRAQLAWEEGSIHPPQVVGHWAEQEPDCGEGVDATVQFAAFFQIIIAELDALERAAFKVEARDEELKASLDHDSTINHRQKAILELALRTPEKELKIESHRAQCGIAYSTARADFLGLVERGFLRQEFNGKAFVFHAVPDLRRVIEKHRCA